MTYVETLPYKLTVTKLFNLVLEETLLAKQTKKDKSEISMKMKIILIAIIASCYAAPGYEKSKNDYKLLTQPQAKNDYKRPTQVQKQPSPQAKNDYKRPPQVQKQPSPQAKNDYYDAAAYTGPNAQYYQQPANRGYEQPAHRGYEQPANRGYEKPVYQGYVQPANRGPASRVGSILLHRGYE